MSDSYVKKEVDKILKDEKYEYPLNTAMAAAWIIANSKGINIKIFDMKESSSLCDFNVIATAENTVQAKTMVDDFSQYLKEKTDPFKSLEGVDDGEWILLDLGDIIIHIFQENARYIFDLDSLWQDREQIEIPQEFYFGQRTNGEGSADSSLDYF